MSMAPRGIGTVVVDTGETVSIITLTLLISSAIAVLARISVKWTTSKGLHCDDALIFLALLCYAGSGAAVSILDKNGLGLGMADMSMGYRDIFAKSNFAADMLFMGTLCFAKLSIVALFNLVAQQRRHRVFACILHVAISMWSVVFLLARAFACELPKPWGIPARCSNLAAFWYTYEAMNMVMDILVIAFTMYITAPLHMSKAKKFMLLVCFGTRFFDVLATIVQLLYTNDFRSTEFAVDIWRWILISQVIQCITIITSCIPYLRPLLESLPSGMFRSDEMRRQGSSSTNDHTAQCGREWGKEDRGAFLVADIRGSTEGSRTSNSSTVQENSNKRG